MKEIVIIASCLLAAILLVGILSGLGYAAIRSIDDWLQERREKRHRSDAEYPRLRAGGRRR